MREMLFKGKRLDNGEWVKGFFFQDELKKAYIAHYVPSEYSNGTTEYSLFCVDPKTVCQYTGLTDSRGNEIWEKDVCLYTDKYDDNERCVVKYGRYETPHEAGTHFGFYLDWLEAWNGKDICGHTEDVYTFFEVIGNVFDNPELIQEEE